MRFDDLVHEPCSISRPLAVLGDRWTLVIVKEAFAGTRRFDDFLAHLQISRSRLSDRLTRLVDAGVLDRCVSDATGRPEYRLTPKGLDLYPVLQALRAWGDAHMADDGPPMLYRHRGCERRGSVEVLLRCDGCGEELGARDVEVAAGPGLT